MMHCSYEATKKLYSADNISRALDNGFSPSARKKQCVFDGYVGRMHRDQRGHNDAAYYARAANKNTFSDDNDSSDTEKSPQHLMRHEDCCKEKEQSKEAYNLGIGFDELVDECNLRRMIMKNAVTDHGFTMSMFSTETKRPVPAVFMRYMDVGGRYSADRVCKLTARLYPRQREVTVGLEEMAKTRATRIVRRKVLSDNGKANQPIVDSQTERLLTLAYDELVDECNIRRYVIKKGVRNPDFLVNSVCGDGDDSKKNHELPLFRRFMDEAGLYSVKLLAELTALEDGIGRPESITYKDLADRRLIRMYDKNYPTASDEHKWPEVLDYFHRALY